MHTFSCGVQVGGASFGVSHIIAVAGILWGTVFISFPSYIPFFGKSCANISSPAVTFKIEFITVSCRDGQAVPL